MKQYEYKVEEHSEWEPSSWQENDYLNKIGKDGWELCNVMERWAHDPRFKTSYVYYWKRLKQEYIND